MGTPDKRREDIERAVRAVFNSLDKLPKIGSLITEKSIYFFIKEARNKETIPTANPIIRVKDRMRYSEKKLPNEIINLVEAGSTTPSSLNVPASVGTTKANINTPIKIIAERITPG